MNNPQILWLDSLHVAVYDWSEYHISNVTIVWIIISIVMVWKVYKLSEVEITTINLFKDEHKSFCILIVWITRETVIYHST